MALPTPDKQWIFKSFQTYTTGTSSTDWKNFWVAFAKAMTTSAGWTTQAGASTTNSHPWTISASSNGSVAVAGYDSWTTLRGTDTNANVNTSGGNNVLRIRTSTTAASYSVYTVTSGASVAKTTIVSDLNTAFGLAGSTLQASITGTNQLTITDTVSTNNGYVQIDSIANGSTLGTPCGFTSGGMNTGDNITYAANFSWIILRQPSINTTFEICWALNSSSNYQLCSTYVSHLAGFTLTGLATNAVPNANDRVQHLNGGSVNGASTNTWNGSFVIAMSTDGECTRIFGYYNNACRTFWLYDKPKNPISAWTNPAVCLMQTNTGALTPTAYTEVTDYPLISARLGTLTFWNYVTTEFYGSAAIGENQTVRNQITGEWQMTPCGLASATPGAYGRHGELYDLWFTSTFLTLGATFPGTTTRDFIVLPYLVHPWNQSDLILN